MQTYKFDPITKEYLYTEKPSVTLRSHKHRAATCGACLPLTWLDEQNKDGGWINE